MKKKNKKKGKNKTYLTIVLSILLLIIVIGIIYFLGALSNKNTLAKIKENYNKYIIIKKDTNIYNKNKKMVGKIYKGVTLELEEIKNISLKNKYLKIKDSDYYIYFKDINKKKDISKTSINSNYIVLNKNIKSNKDVTLYENDKKVITLNSINLQVQYMDNKNYYVYYLNKLLRIKKNKNIKIIKNKNTERVNTNNVSILYYENIQDVCGEDTNCISTLSFKQQINKLKNNNYYFITEKEYNLYNKKYLNLKDKPILLVTSNITDNIKNITNELNITMNKSNKNILSNEDTFKVRNYTPLENIMKVATGEKVMEEEQTNKVVSVPVLNYHFFYNPTIGEECNESICLETDKFESHLKYIKENDFYALTMDEFAKWIYGEIDIPEKSVLITIDDGAMGTGKHNGNKLIPLLEKYELHATLFLIAGWWDISNYQSTYLEVQSHTYDMHKYGDCGKGQLVCANYEEAKQDLQKSLDIIGNNTSFCYPFYRYDDEAIQALKDLGFRIAFAGGNKNATRNSNKYIIPRYPIQNDVTLDDIKNILN